MGKVIRLFGHEGAIAMNVLDVAKIFLSMESMSHKKLQKLCYYTQAWHLALLKKPLFNEKFEAWIHGPVSPYLYQIYKKHGWNYIPIENGTPQNVKPEDVAFIEDVYAAYGKFTGDDLEFLSHSEEPWINARKGLDPMAPCENIIDENLMESFYWRQYEQTQGD